MVLFLLIHDFDQEGLTCEGARASWFVLISQNLAKVIYRLYTYYNLYKKWCFVNIYGSLSQQVTHYYVL